MVAPRSSDSDGPLTWIGNFPVYASTALAGVHAATLVLTALALAAGAESALQIFVFSSSAVTRDLSLWQLATYAFVHMPPYWVFLIEVYLLVVFGRELESYLGRWAFLRLYLTLLLAPTLLFTAADWMGWQTVCSGSSALHFGIFVAFALIYPTAEMFFGIQAKWIALALLAINSLQCLALSDYEGLAVLAADCVAACLFIAIYQGRISLRLPARRRAIPAGGSPQRQSASRKRGVEVPAGLDEDLHDSIDPILDKISQSGLASLTPRERERLENARHKLIAKDGGS
jgi:membrane associated rhomboid family serine protease